VRAAPSGPRPSLAATTILVAEDEALVRELIVCELDDAGFLVLEAGSAEEALEILEQRNVDLLFTDIRMPGRMDGWDLAEEARRRDPAIKVVYTTGYSQERPRPVPNSLHVRKPYRAFEVIQAIEKLRDADPDPSPRS
jgi:CheY-like chemotaxis protein